MVKANLVRVKERIRQAAERAGRDPNTVTLVVVTKKASVEEIRAVIETGEKEM